MRLKQTPNRPCSKCGATMANGFDIEVEDGKAYQVSWLECDECGHALKPKRKYLGLEADMWPDYEPDEAFGTLREAKAWVEDVYEKARSIQVGLYLEENA